MSDQEIEKEIQAKGLTAPRITPDQIESVITSETYTILPNGRTTVCQLTLKNGFTVEGMSSCVSIENFNEEIGNKIARENAVQKIWPLEGYLLKQKLSEYDPYIKSPLSGFVPKTIDGKIYLVNDKGQSLGGFYPFPCDLQNPDGRTLKEVALLLDRQGDTGLSEPLHKMADTLLNAPPESIILEV